MIHVRPFRAWRPVPHTAHLVGSRSFVTYSREQLQEKLAGNPYSFLHVIHPTDEAEGHGRAAHFDHVRRKFLEFTAEGILERDTAPAFYLYEQSCAAFTSRGIIGAVDVADYRAGRIKRHEETLAHREELFTEYLDHTGINAEPVLLAMPDDAAFEADLDAFSQFPALFDFVTTDRIRHRFWKVDRPAGLDRLTAHFNRLEAMYIADGHHRCASSVRLAEKHHAASGSPKAAFLAFMVPEQQLHIHNYDRTVRGLNGLSEQEFLDAMGHVGRLQPMPNGPCEPQRGTVQVYTQRGWHSLELPASVHPDAASNLDSSLLNEHVLAPLLGITDLRNDPRAGFVPGPQGTGALEQAVRSGKADAAFHLRSATFSQLCDVADAHQCMPPKSTWIEPKLRSGLTIYSLDDL
jgi:uncharacterized protein (DUF1015 family)